MIEESKYYTREEIEQALRDTFKLSYREEVMGDVVVQLDAGPEVYEQEIKRLTQDFFTNIHEHRNNRTKNHLEAKPGTTALRLNEDRG